MRGSYFMDLTVNILTDLGYVMLSDTFLIIEHFRGGFLILWRIAYFILLKSITSHQLSVL